MTGPRRWILSKTAAMSGRFRGHSDGINDNTCRYYWVANGAGAL